MPFIKINFYLGTYKFIRWGKTDSKESEIIQELIDILLRKNTKGKVPIHT